jgi:RNA polymerase sigma factor (sigma-70 family)
MELRSLLLDARRDLLRYVERHAGRLLRYDGAEDLVQQICVRVLEQEGAFEYRGEEPFFAWLYGVARSCMQSRREYWAALKRRPAGLLRLTAAASSDSGAAAEPAITATGPSTFAARREELTIAVRALGVLMERDRQLVHWASEGLDTATIAERLGLTQEAATRARHRALGRFRKAHHLLSKTYRDGST